MKIRLFTIITILFATIYASASELPIVPRPAEITKSDQQPFILRKDMKIYNGLSDESSSRHVVSSLISILPEGAETTEHFRDAHVALLADTMLPAEAYTLEITPAIIIIKSSRPAGAFYGVMSLMQIISGADNGELDCLTITDNPRFEWRGFMLDEGRHIFGKEEVKRLLDLMAIYKLNRFHWHLTEDQGWRIEITKYPRLTETGAWRESEKLGWKEIQSPEKLDKPYGGFYTCDDIREIVAYAGERFIEVIPEIDIPGHTRAAIAAYPEILACDPDSTHTVWLWQGVTDDVMNVANPAAVEMATDIIDEVADLFPYGYIHLGGDECPTEKWQKNKMCQSRLKELNSDNYRDLQLDFYSKLQQHMNRKDESKRKKFIFWNEVLHGNTNLLTNDITVMAWIGTKEADEAALDAAQKGYDAILTPQIPFYLNRKQSTSPDEPLTQGEGHETVEAVYSYVPMSNTPDSLKHHYKGVQANFWSEYVATPELLEYLLLPRLAAVAETAWTPQEKKDFNSFSRRIRKHRPIYEARGYNFAPHIFGEKR